MIVREIVTTCSNPHVARAAVLSIGGKFAHRFAYDAGRRELSVGAYAAKLVRDFSRCASEQEWDEIEDVAHGADQPILAGLRHILERRRTMMDETFESAASPSASWGTAWARAEAAYCAN